MAFNSSDDIEIRIVVDSTGAVRQLGRVDEEINKIDRSSKSALGGVSNLERNIISIGTAAIATAGSIQGIQKAIQGIQRGAAINDVAENFQKLSLAAGALSSKVLPDLRRAVGGTISDFELMRQSNELLRAGLDPRTFSTVAEAARLLADQVGGDTATAFEQLSSDLIRGTDRQLKFLGITLENVKANSEAERVEKMRALAIEALTQKLAVSGPVADDAADAIDRMKVALENQSNLMLSSVANSDLLNISLNTMASFVENVDFSTMMSQATVLNSIFTNLNTVIREFNELFGGSGANTSAAARLGAQIGASVGAAGDRAVESERKLKEWLDALRNAGNAGNKAAEQVDRLAEAQKNLNRAIKAASGTDGIAELDEALRKIIVDFKFGTISAQQFADQINAIGNGASSSGLNTIATELGKVTSEVESNFEDISKIFDPSNIEDDLKEYSNSVTEFFSETFGDDLGSSLENTFANTIGDSLSAALHGGDWKQIGRDFAKDIGRDLGESIGGPIGGEIGAALGDAVFEAFDHAFGGGRDPGAKARKSVDAWFAEIFNADRLTVIVDGELQKIKDLVFSASGDSSEFESGAFDDVFATLPAASMEAFNAVGAGFEALLAEMGINMEEISGQLAAVFFNNVGGSISDLRLLLEATGQTAEQLADALMEAFLEGSLSALEFARNLRGLERTLQKGIPEAIGAIDVAWQRVIDAGFDGGRALLDAIQSVAIEAQELGINTMPDLANIMISTFGIASDQVAIFMQAMAAAGVNSLAALAEASNETLAAIAANMQAITEGQPDRFQPVQISRPSFGGGGGGGGGTRGPSAAEREAERAAEEKRRRKEELKELILGTEKWEQTVEMLTSGLIANGEAMQIFNQLTKEATKLSRDLEKAEARAAKELEKKGKISFETAKKITELRDAIESLGDITDKTLGSESETFSINSEFFDFINKFTDNINALELAADAAGLSFKELQSEAIAAFKAGDLTATEALKRLNGGVDGKDETTVDTFRRIREGAEGGILSIDALRDLAKNVLKGGGDSFEDIIKALTEGGESMESIQDLFISLKRAGVKSLEDLSKVTDEKAIEIFSNLEGLDFPFIKASEETKRLRDEINQIPNAKKVDIEINAILDPKTKKLLERLGILEDLKSYGNNSPGVKSRANR